VALPKDDAQLHEAWLAHGSNNAKTAEHFGVQESAVRKRMYRYAGVTPRPYTRLPLAGKALLDAWVNEGADRNAAGRLATIHGVKAQSIRAALRRYFKTQPI
jgi:hypothetical protein